MNNEKKLGLDSAFPVSDPNTAIAMFNAGIDPTGISKRFYAACAAMQGLLSNHVYMDSLADKFEDADIEVVKDAYGIADKLLKAEQL